MPFSSFCLKTLFLTLIISPSLWAGAVPKTEEQNMIYGSWKLPSEFSMNRIEKLLHQLSEETFNKGFRYLGVEEDLFHGHVLFERKKVNGSPTLFPRAILYHTQEEAHKAHWEKSIDPKYDYLNVTTRNWIQWLSDDSTQDGTLVENAKKYLDVTKKDPSQFENDFAEPQEKLHYTIHASNLDNQKLGFILAGELQFEFYVVKDKEFEFPDNHYLGIQGPITVELPNHETVNLKLRTGTMYIERNSTNHNYQELKL